MQAASSDPLFDDWSSRLEDPNKVTSRSAKVVAARAQSLVEDWTIGSALVRAILLATHGARGLRFRSHFQSDDAPETTDAERSTRREIEATIRARPDVDASGTMSRRRLEKMQDWYAVVMGDGYLVRVNQGVSRWRLVHPFRVRNPNGKVNSETMQDGHEFGADGRPIALWVDNQRASDLTLPTTAPIRIPWTSPDGTPNVSHRVRWGIPGSVRGLSSFAPLMLPARMLQGVTEAYTAAKRVQAQIPLLLSVPDLKTARENYRGSRLANLLLGPQSSVQFPSWKFDGADYQAFTDTEIRSICAAWGIPWELVLNDHSAKSGASARSMWQAFYQQADEWQMDHAEQTTALIDQAIVRERQITDPIPGLTDDWTRNMAGVYQGPPRIMPDPLKEAQAATAWDMLDRSRSSAFADQGWDYREEVMQRSQDEELSDAQGGEHADAPASEQPSGSPDDSGAADSPDSSEDQSPPDDPQPTAAIARSDDMRASDVVEILKAMAGTAQQAPQPVQIIQRMEVSAESAALMGEAIGRSTPMQPAAVVNVAAPSVTVEAAQVSVPAPNVTVNVPQQAAPVVMATATAPAVHFHAPDAKPRRQRAVEQDDGSVILEDVT